MTVKNPEIFLKIAREPMSALTHFIAFVGAFFGLLVLLYVSIYPVIKPLNIITFSILLTLRQRGQTYTFDKTSTFLYFM